MRVLIVGAGAIGGYFGGRMLQAGRGFWSRKIENALSFKGD
jgi:ketopantoate reductase